MSLAMFNSKLLNYQRVDHLDIFGPLVKKVTSGYNQNISDDLRPACFAPAAASRPAVKSRLALHAEERQTGAELRDPNQIPGSQKAEWA